MNRVFKDIVRDIQKKYGVSKGDIANKLGVSREYVSRLTSGAYPFNDTIRAKVEETFPDIKLDADCGQMGVENEIMSFMRSKVYTVYDMAKILGVPVSEVTETIAGGFDKKTAELWSERFGFDKDFLLTGDGQLIAQKENYVPLIPVLAQAGKLAEFAGSVADYECEKILSPVKDAELAVSIVGDSMSPEYPSGSIVFVKKINEKAFIEWGKTYVLDTINGAIIKYLAPGSEDGYVKCISANPEPMYAPFEVSLSDVYGIYRVVNMLCMK